MMKKMVIYMRIRHPLEFEIMPEKIDAGTRWVTVRIKNIGSKNLTNLDVRLNSRDSYYLNPLGTSEFVFELKPNEERLIPFKVEAGATSELYVSVNGYKEGLAFYLESPNMLLRVTGQIAELRSMFVMAEPYTPIGETLKCEAKIMGLEKSENLDLEFWADTPSGKFEKLADIKTKELSPGEEATYSAEITPKERGIYTVYAYLYDQNDIRIDHQTDSVIVRE
jgi:hypothetical protein